MRATDKSSSLTEAFSLYLDLVRFAAALLVVLAHYLQYRIVGPDLARFVPNMGREAVVIFFVLSGFVIAYVTQSKATPARDYVAARCGRIYSVVLPALLLAWLLAGVLGTGGLYQLAKPWIYLPLHLLFLGQSWNLSLAPPLLPPFWSLCYEVWYYVLFGVACYLTGWRRTVAVVAVLAVMGPKLWLLLPVWLSGVALYQLQRRLVLPQSLARLGFVLSLALLAAYNLSGMEAVLRGVAAASWPFAALPLASAERFLGDYLVCLLVVAHFLCARHAGLDALLRFGGPIRAAAAYTFTLYLSHMLVVFVWLQMFARGPGNWADAAGVSLAIACITIALAQITERRKAHFRQPVDWVLRRTFPARA